jgi:AhpD family alkylhydroperoxidase
VTPPATRPTELRVVPHDGEGLSETFAKTVRGEDGKPLPIFTVLAHHEQLLRRFNGFGALLRTSPVTDLAHRELIVLRVAWRTDCTFEFDQHAPIARDAGVPETSIAAARDAAPPPEEPVERLLLNLADEIIDHDCLTDETWALLGERWDTAQTLELVMTTAFFRMAAAVINSVGLRPRATW